MDERCDICGRRGKTPCSPWCMVKMEAIWVTDEGLMKYTPEGLVHYEEPL